jgi:hypothetical protein
MRPGFAPPGQPYRLPAVQESVYTDSQVLTSLLRNKIPFRLFQNPGFETNPV